MNNKQMVKITIKSNTPAWSSKTTTTSAVAMYPGDTVMAIKDGDYYYIINYQTSSATGKDRAKDIYGSDSRCVTGKYIKLSNIRTNGNTNFVVENTDTLVDWDSFKQTGTASTNIKYDSRGNIVSATESLNCKYKTNATTTKDPMTGRDKPSPGAIGALEAAGESYATKVGGIRKANDYTYTQNYSDGSTVEYKTDLPLYTAKVQDFRIRSLRGVLGIPHQFIPTTDPRITGDVTALDSLGRNYAAHIIKNMPLLIITPGKVKFAPAATKSARSSMMGQLLGVVGSSVGGAIGEVITASVFDIDSGGYTGKYYQLDYDVVGYYQHVNLMLRAAATFLGLEDETIDGVGLAKKNWRDGNNNLVTRSEDLIGNYYLNKVASWLNGNDEPASFGTTSVALYANCGESVQDSFANDTTQSQLANSINSMSDSIREYKFLAGGLINKNLPANWDAGVNMTGDVGNAIGTGIGNIHESTGGGFSSIVAKAQTILAGGRLIFPDIWSNSTFGRSYSVNMKLISPSGDKLSIYLNILVPIYHILGFTLPKQSLNDAQGYVEPYLIRMYYKGMFHVDIGIVSGLSITKGAEGEWTKDGLPTVAEVQFDVKDMYQSLPMSGSAIGLYSNIEELDYIANSCAININSSEQTRAWKLFRTIWFKNIIRDYIDNDIVGRFTEWANNAMNNMFGFSNYM